MTSILLTLPMRTHATEGHSLKALATAALLAVLTAAANTPARSQHLATDCSGAEIALRQKLMPLLRHTDSGTNWLVRNSIASARIARGYCHGDTPERGLLIYRRIIETIDTWMPTVETGTQLELTEAERSDLDLAAIEDRPAGR